MLLLLIGVCQISAKNTYAQTVSLSFSLKNTTIEGVLDKIEEETEFSFLVMDKSVDLNKKVDHIQANRESINPVLDRLFKDADVAYRIIDRQIVLMPTAMEAALANVSQQAGRTVTGTVKDPSGDGIIGASVQEKGTTNGIITDLNGNFSLTVNDNAVLRIFFLGYVTLEIPVTGKSNIQVVMQEDLQNLDEVVIIGYGVQKKINLTGAISNVKTDDLTAIPTSNLSNTLAGRAPGVTIIGNSGLIGATSTIRMRGGFGEPLFVIDGVISNKEAFDALEATEVDQMSFLKDAATASVYGTSAGNGVILVTTKTGDARIAKPKFDYQGTYSVSNPTQTLFTDLFTATDELIYQNRVAEFKGQALPNGEGEFAYFENRDYNVNDYIWQNPWNMKHSLSVTGGADKFKYYIMAGYMQEEGSYLNLENEKYNVRSNLTAQLSKAISVNLNLSAYQTNGNRFYWTGSPDDSQDVYDFYRCTFNATRTLPFYSYEDGTPATEKTDYPIRPEIGSWTGWNPVDQVVGNRYIKTRKRNMNGTLSFNIDLESLTPGLSTKVLFNYTGDDYMRKKFMTEQKNYIFQRADPSGNRFLPAPLDKTKYSIFDFNTGEHLQYGMRTLWSEQFNWFLNYDRTFDKHGVSGMVVFEQATNGGEFVYAEGKEPLAYIDQMFAFSTDAENRYGDADEYVGAHLSWIGRFNYNYAQKYIAEFSFRYDGSTLFAPGKRWGFFPSVSAAWRIEQENFMESTREWMSNLKLRLSYGTTGNDLDVSNNPISPFSYLSKYIAGTSYIVGSEYLSGIKPGTVPNPNITWATSTTYNVGLDPGFLDGRLQAGFDAFYRTEENILGTRTATLPSTYGQTLAPENYAKRSWRGGEVTLSWRNKAAGGKIEYSVYANMGYAKDRWEILDESAVYKTGNLQDLSQVGYSGGRQTGLIAVGLLRTQEQIDEINAKNRELFGKDLLQYGRALYLGGILYKDTRGDSYLPGADGKIDANDAYNLLSDNAVPRLNYGFGGEISWKGLTLSAHFQGVGSYDKFVSGYDAGIYQHGGSNRPYFPLWTSPDLWTPENPDGKYPRVVGSSWYESGVGRTTFWQRNGAYIRLKNLNIGYKIPKSILNLVSLTEAQVFFNGTNLFALSELTEFYMDPEQAYYDSYPLMKTFTFGLNVSF
ncbi:MAG: TonB-dependent receptor [Candidatus Symbiothrix sp.]|jgi:TonB-linked SusC/RagA family outer membrane protein|nr:TonB-dependent receptor [Candidatus Symbiothrix sp.]